MDELFKLLPNLLNEHEDNPKVREAVIFAAWRKIAGKSLCDHAVPLNLNQKHLTVAVATERWEKYLKDLSGQMIFKINSVLRKAAVTFIDFRVNEEFVQAEREKRRGKTFDENELRKLALNQVTTKLRTKADAIKDDNLRDIFLLAAGSCLARKEKMKNANK